MARWIIRLACVMGPSFVASARLSSGPWCSIRRWGAWRSRSRYGSTARRKRAIAAMSQMSSSLKPWDFSISKSASPTVSAEWELEREVEHRLLALRDVGVSVVDCHLVGDQRVLGPDPQDRPVGD